MAPRPLYRHIGIASSPNTDWQDVRLALSILARPGTWLRGQHIHGLEEAFRHLYGAPHAVAFESGRAALYHILKGWGIGPGDEVILQAFTCVVVPDAVIWTGATPIYTDVRDDFNIDPELIREKLSSRTRAIVIQHTFGHPAAVDRITALAREFGLRTVEDCAHVIRAPGEVRLPGHSVDAVFFSFGQEKAISSVRGGLALTWDDALGDQLKRMQDDLPPPARRDVVRNLLHPILWAVAVPTYDVVKLGRATLWIAARLHLATSLISPPELAGGKPPRFPSRMANGQAAQALAQVGRVNRFNQVRIAISDLYRRRLQGLNAVTLPPPTDTPLLRFSIRVRDPGGLRRLARGWHVVLGNWYDSVVYPGATTLSAVHYQPGSCPIAESLSHEVVNLPTHPRMSLRDAERVVRLVQQHVASAAEDPRPSRTTREPAA